MKPSKYPKVENLQSCETSTMISIASMHIDISILVFHFRVDGEEKLFEARVYKVRDYWKIDIRVDKENQDAQVFHVHDDGKEERLIAKDVRQYSLEKKGSRFNIKNITAGVRTVTSIASLVFDILDFFSV